MPIKPENRALYPKDWKCIVAEVRARDGNTCKICKVPNGAIILRVDKDSQLAGVWIDPPGGEMYDMETGELAGYCRGSEFPAGRIIRIVLTTAHLDHDPTNNGTPGDRPNLASLCQAHHLRHDSAHHQQNSAKTRAAKKATGDLFTP